MDIKQQIALFYYVKLFLKNLQTQINFQLGHKQDLLFC